MSRHKTVSGCAQECTSKSFVQRLQISSESNSCIVCTCLSMTHSGHTYQHYPSKELDLNPGPHMYMPADQSAVEIECLCIRVRTEQIQPVTALQIQNSIYLAATAYGTSNRRPAILQASAWRGLLTMVKSDEGAETMLIDLSRSDKCAIESIPATMRPASDRLKTPPGRSSL